MGKSIHGWLLLVIILLVVSGVSLLYGSCREGLDNDNDNGVAYLKKFQKSNLKVLKETIKGINSSNDVKARLDIIEKMIDADKAITEAVKTVDSPESKVKDAGKSIKSKFGSLFSSNDDDSDSD